MKRRPQATTIRRGVTLSRRRQELATAVAAMAEDPQVQAECDAIARDFASAEMDGLKNG